MNKIIVGCATEGPTDNRLLESIVQRTFEAVALECDSEIEVLSPVIFLEKIYDQNFSDKIRKYAEAAHNFGIMALCIHVDADDSIATSIFDNRINPAKRLVEEDTSETICKNIVPLVPIYMSESWMLADKELLKSEIGTDLSDKTLGLLRNPETISNPKTTIQNAIRTARQQLGKRHRSELDIADLYQPIGRQLKLDKLSQLKSYETYLNHVRDAFKKLNYLV